MRGYNIRIKKSPSASQVENFLSVNLPHVVAEIDHTKDLAQHLNKAVRLFSGTAAFRKFSILTSTPGSNVAGNFRGMVLSHRWKTIFDFTTKADDIFKTVAPFAVFASFCGNLGQFRQNIDKITSSSGAWEDKAGRICTEVSSIMIRTVTGGVPAGAHSLAIGAATISRLAETTTGHRYKALSSIAKEADALDKQISLAYDKVTDGSTMYTFIQAHVIIPM